MVKNNQNTFKHIFNCHWPSIVLTKSKCTENNTGGFFFFWLGSYPTDEFLQATEPYYLPFGNFIGTVYLLFYYKFIILFHTFWRSVVVILFNILGFILRLPLWQDPADDNCFDDEVYWEVSDRKEIQ